MGSDPNLDNSDSRPEIKVAIVGAGPAGFYTALDLIQSKAVRAHVDMFDRLPTPYGLVRYGVAPDHQKIKSVTKVYERGVEAAADRFRLFGNVSLGRDVAIDELMDRYHAVVLSFGAQSDRKLGIPGEDLDRVYAARDFVAWYNSHPDAQDATFDLKHSRVVVVGVGNVAIDVARMLSHSPAELAETDVSEAASEALQTSGIQEVVILARRGPLQAKCTPTELRELTMLESADLVIAAEDLELDPLSAEQLSEGDLPRQNVTNYTMMREQALRQPQAGRRVIRMRYYVSPVEILGDEGVEGVRVRHNTLTEGQGDRLAVEPEDDTEVIPCGAVFRSIGYKVEPTPGVPFDAEWSMIPHIEGQVLEERHGKPVPGLFVAGWAKRGPTGVIGTNKPDAAETVASLLKSVEAGDLRSPGSADIAALLKDRGVQAVTYEDWKLLDALEVEAGNQAGRPRVKFPTVAAMLEALAGD